MEDEGGAVFQMDDAMGMWFKCNNVDFDTISANGLGGVFRADNLLTISAVDCDATDISAGT